MDKRMREEYGQSDKQQVERASTKRARRGLLAAIILLFLLAAGGWLTLIEAPAARGPVKQDTLRVQPGMTLGQISSELQARGLLASPFRLKLAARLFGLATGIQQGLFILDSSMSPREMLEALQDYAVPVRRLRVPEAARAGEIAGIVSRELELDSLRLMELVGDSLFIASFGLNQPDLEGLLYPETYLVSEVETEEQVLARLVKMSLSVIDELSPGARPKGHELRELLTMASIVQGEVQLASEADTVAAVYHNRLKQGMRLQADPTVQILLADGPRRLLLKDLEIDSPYNTYLYKGLPPGPIGNPGRVALAAAMKPAECDYLYFVARGDGSHIFAHSYDEHLENRKPLDRLRRELLRDRGRK
jgi:UPF0755 protein